MSTQELCNIQTMTPTEQNIMSVGATASYTFYWLDDDAIDMADKFNLKKPNNNYY